MITENLEFKTLPRDEYSRLKYYPPNCIFFVLDTKVTEQGVVRFYSLYKGDKAVSFQDALSLIPPNVHMDNGGFRAMAFAKSIDKPEKPKETDFEFYKDLVESEGAWRERPDGELNDDESWWVSWHWFNGDETNTLDSGDEWTEPIRMSSTNAGFAWDTWE